MSSFEIDYEEDLIPRIRDLIDGYDKDSILKEYLQNADDSGATELIVTFDKQKYIYLNNTKFEVASGNALLIYNNSQFKEKDFKSIVKISAQGKTEDANSTGRFGQGFSSSFSISDHPSFISNGRAYWFDVLKVAVSKDKSKSIQGWEYKKSKDITDWIKTFKIAGFDNNFTGTIFRLPLRDEISAEKSKISNEIFTYEDFLKWVEEWKDNSENLLFLRHIHRLVLQEADESGNIKILLEIKTKNKDEIEKYNNKIQNEFNDKELMQICESWENSSKELPIFTYKHNFEIKYNEEINHKKFAIVNGLFRGRDNILIKQAKEVLNITPNPRKVLPWVGVGIELDDKDEPIKAESKLFTFLPLPIKSNYPIHIHGWFDLNPKRTEITNTGSGYDKETLIEWNRLILEEGVSKAWVMLIDFLKKDEDSHYNIWAKDTEFELNDSLIKGFYTHIIDIKPFFVSIGYWDSPKNTTLYYLNSNDKELFEIFEEHFPIIQKKPSKYIIDNLKNIGIELTEITPDFIREYLKKESKNIKFPINIEKIPIRMLQKKEWFIKVLEFCANDKDYHLIEGLPLELTLDENIYKIGSSTLFDKNPDLTLFQDMKHLFIDTDIVKSIDNYESLPSSWINPTLKNKLTLLFEYWEKLDFSKKWIQVVIDLIVNAEKYEFGEAIEEIKDLEIVYQKNGTYAKLESKIANKTPFMPRDEDVSNNLKYLEEISMNIVHPEYLDIYKPLVAKQKGLITHLNSKTLIEHLLILDDYEFFKEKNLRDFLLDILTRDISWIDKLEEYRENIFYSMPFIETAGGKVYAKNSDVKLYLPSGFAPPKDIESLISEHEVISVEPSSNLYSLYEKIDIERLDIDNYIQDVIIPFLENTENILDRRDVLKWLATEWKSFEDKLSDTTVEKVKNSKIIPSFEDEDKLFKPDELYMPTIELPLILNDNHFKPIIFKDEEIDRKWIDFLELIGASNTILPPHIIAKIKEIEEKNDISSAIELLNYIANNFEAFEEMNILDTLKEYDWFPADKPKDILKPKSEYALLKKPNELILNKDFKIAGGYYHILNNRVKLGKKDEKGEIKAYEMAEKLGIVTNIPNEHFFESFRELMKLSPTNGQVVKYAKEVYKYIGRRFKSIDDVKIDEDERSILINNQWIEPKFVYQTKINLSNVFSWDSLVQDNKESELAKGLGLLGVREKPSIDFLIDTLKNLPQEKKLDNKQLKDAKAILDFLQKDEEECFDDIPLLTHKNELINFSKVYINDFPAYKNAKEKNEDLHFCQNQFERLAKSLGVDSLSDNYDSKIDKYEKCDVSSPIMEIIKQDYFKEAILRLLYHEKKIKEDEIDISLLNDILPSSIIFVSKLVIDYLIDNIFLFSSDETTYEENGELYILEQEEDDDLIEVVAKYVCDTRKLSRDSFGWIERILRKQMDREKIQKFLDRKKVRELPEKFDLEDEPTLFDKNNDLTETDQETNYDKTISHEDYTEDKIETKKDIKPPIEPKKSFETTNRTVYENKSILNKSQLKTEAEPPIKPKSALETGNSKSINNLSFNSEPSVNTHSKIISSNDFKPVYVGKDRKADNEGQKAQRESAKEIGDKGENYILLQKKESLLLKSSHDFYKAPPNNKGYDLTEQDSRGKIIRYIEVKTLTGRWREGGIAITKHQLEFAQKQKDKWWLFVVEGINTDSPKVYQFKNPVIEANRFVFDGSWKQLAYSNGETKHSEPKKGDKYEIEIDGKKKIAKILDVIGKGALLKVELILENGKTINKRFKKDWRKVDG